MIRYTLTFLYVFFTCDVHGQIHQQIRIVHESLKDIETSLQKLLTNQTANTIKYNLTQAKQKITSLENAFPTSNEKHNPFLPGFIQETKQKIDELELLLAAKKRSLQESGLTNDYQPALTLLEQWYTFQLNSINSFEKIIQAPSDPFAPPGQNDLFALAKIKEDNTKKALATFYTNAIQAVQDNLKTIQNAFFDFSLNYQSTCDQEHNNIIHSLTNKPPALPKRSSSLSKKIVPAAEPEQLINKPTVEKGFLEEIQEHKANFTKTIEEKVSQAKEFAAKHMLSIEQSISILQKPEPKRFSKQKTKNVSPEEHSTPLINVKMLVDAIYQTSSSYKTLRFYALNFDMLHRLMNFITLPNMPLFSVNKSHITQMADNNAIIMQKLIHSLITKKNDLYANNIFHAELYYATFVLPTSFYGMLINSKLSWVSDKAKLLSNKIELYLEKNKHAPYTFDLLSNEQIEECVSYTKAILEKASLLLPEDLLNAHFFLCAVTTITGAGNNGIIQLQKTVNHKTIDYIKSIKNSILSFIHNSLFKTISSPFQPSNKLFCDIFIQFSGVKSIELFWSLYKASPYADLSEAVYHETVLAKQAIYNAFKVCAQKTKDKIDKNSGLRTAWTILYEQLERIIVLLKPIVKKQEKPFEKL